MVRRAFTLVEMLVVIAIIGVLVALLLPAVQAARESARKTGCQNNLHNLALACIQYHDSVLSLPSGWIVATQGQQPQPGIDGWGWGALVLPHLEQGNLHSSLGVLYDSLNSAIARPDRPNNPTLLQTPLKIFVCPSDSNMNNGLVDKVRILPNFKLSMASSTYIGVAGHRRVSGNTPNSGLFYGNSYVRMSDIIDGTSNTAMLGERDTTLCHSAAWAGTANSMNLTSAPTLDASMTTGYDQPKLNAQGGNTDNTIGPTLCSEGFSSLHPGGAQFAFADGSVRFITNGISHNYVNTTGNPALGAAPNDYKLAADAAGNPSGIYNRMMSRSDKLPTNDQ